MNDRKITRRVTEYRVNELDEYGDIVDTDGYDRLKEAFDALAKSEAGEPEKTFEIERVRQRWEAYEDNVVACEMKNGKGCKFHTDAGWELVDSDYETVTGSAK